MTIKVTKLIRAFDAPTIEVRKDANLTRLSFSASSEQPVDRWFGSEVLRHTPEAVRLGRAQSGAMPLLFNHNPDAPIGMIDGAKVENARLMVDAHLFDTERAQEVGAMIAGGMRNISIGYRLHTVDENAKTNTFTATDWEPYEVSVAPVPADASIGIGRSNAMQEFEVSMTRASEPAAPAAEPKGNNMSEATAATAGALPAQPAQGMDGATTEKLRINTILALSRQNYGGFKPSQEDADRWINEGKTPDEVSQAILEQIAVRTKANPQSKAEIGMSPKEVRQYSLMRALRAAAENNWKDAGFELEANRAICTKLNRIPEQNSFLIPFEVLQRPTVQQQNAQRDISVAAGGGGYLVETTNMGFIDMLRNRSVAFRMGVQRLTGLVGNVNIPKQSAAATAYWLTSETNAITESAQTFIQIPLSPKTAGAYTEISRLLLLQSSPDAETIVTRDLSTVVALAVDLGVIAGTGTAQPQGIIGTSGVGTVTGTSFDYADILEFQTDVASANVVPVSGGYVATPTVAGLAMARFINTTVGTALWTGGLWDGQMAGYPAMSSMQVPTGDMLFGDWSTVVVAEWGVLEIAVNPVANFAAGIIGIRAMYTMDVGVRHPAAFSLATSCT
jgi:HK97 family phage major capsid protein/HK97 family phage prohead protease